MVDIDPDDLAVVLRLLENYRRAEKRGEVRHWLCQVMGRLGKRE